MKKTIKVYLDPEQEKKLKQKATALFPGRASISKYITHIANNDIIFMDKNVQSFADLFLGPK